MAIGSVVSLVNGLFKKTGVSCAGFITAWNPYSKELSKQDNQERNESLKTELITRSLKFIDGFGQDPEGKWSGEKSFLVLSIGLEAAKKLGDQLEQNAIVWVDSNAILKLIFLR